MASLRRRRKRLPIARWLGLGGLVLAALLYYRPVTSYVETKRTLEQRSAEVHVLEAQQRLLQRRLARAGSRQSLVRQARRLGLVKPGERLFIVKGIPQWRHAGRTAAR
jgi:cell division protein FtsB